MTSIDEQPFHKLLTALCDQTTALCDLMMALCDQVMVLCDQVTSVCDQVTSPEQHENRDLRYDSSLKAPLNVPIIR